MRPCKRRFAGGGCALVLVFVGSPVAIAGDLDPPAGPITSTMKPLDQVEPRIVVNATNTPGDVDSVFRIAQPGSYYLTGNVAGEAGKHGIQIESDGVTLDLNGFSLIGVAGSLDGIYLFPPGGENVVIRNGHVLDWGQSGIEAFIQTGRIEGITAARNGEWGIDSQGFTANIIDCDVFLNGIILAGTGGIRVGGIGQIAGCVARNNLGDGIRGGGATTITDCTSTVNGGAGIFLSGPANVINCTTSFNTLAGISGSIGAKISGCLSNDNTGDGIVASSGSVVTGCSSYSNNARGIFAGIDSIVSNCSSSENAADGIFAGSGSTVSGCTSSGNSGDGIEVQFDSLVTGNVCDSNGTGVGGDGAGIHVVNSDNRIEGNQCSDSDRGIDVDSTGNIIIRNTCAANTTNWDIVANNVFGPIIDRTAPASPAVVGNSAASSLGSTDANANFTY